MYEKVFRNAVDLGREQELFGITKDQKETLDASVAYIQVLGENELLGMDPGPPLTDFLVSW